MHALEILGTVLTVLFTIMSVIFIKLFWVDAIAPVWVAVLGTVVLGGASIWACIKVFSWWHRKLKDYFAKKK